MDNTDKDIINQQSEDNTKGCQCNSTECCSKLQTYDWLNDLPASIQKTNIVEVRFKNTRKDFFINTKPDNYLVDVNCNPDETFPYDQIPNGKEYSWHRGNFDVPFYYYENRIIWGLTARIIMNLVSLLK